MHYYQDAESLGKFLQEPSSLACESGLLHGLLSGMLHASPERADVTYLLQLCTTLVEGGRIRACGDSIGHVIWEIEQSFQAASDWCLEVTSPAGDACVEGVFMQLYKPVAPVPKAREAQLVREGVALSQTEIVNLCNGLEGERASVACAVAAYYSSIQDFDSVQVLDMRSDAGTTFRGMFAESLDFCARFTRGSTECMERITGHALSRLFGVQHVEILCENLPWPPFTPLCLKHIAYYAGRNLKTG